MPLDPISAAKRMCKQSEWSLSNLKLQKILYLANMFHLGDKGTSLVEGNFKAWDYGPVHPEVYHFVKMFGAKPIRNIFGFVKDPPEGTETDFIDKAVEALKDKSSTWLVQITHRKEGAWMKHYIPGIKCRVIPNDDIKEEYDYECERQKQRRKSRV